MNLASFRKFNNTCKYQNFYPNTSPIIYNLSQSSSQSENYTILYIYGLNFLYNSTTVTFGTITNIPVNFYTSNDISFSIPINSLPGSYSVQVVTIPNTIPTVLLSSNIETYTITS